MEATTHHTPSIGINILLWAGTTLGYGWAMSTHEIIHTVIYVIVSGVTVWKALKPEKKKRSK